MLKNVKIRHRTEDYKTTMEYAKRQIISDLKDKWFLSFFVTYLVMFFVTLIIRQKHPWIYISFLAGLNALVIAWFGRLGLVFIPAAFVLGATLERYYNLRI
jgi:hypothetical protein